MIRTVAVQGYRSLRDLLLPLGQLSVITGANGSGNRVSVLAKHRHSVISSCANGAVEVQGDDRHGRVLVAPLGSRLQRPIPDTNNVFKA